MVCWVVCCVLRVVRCVLFVVDGCAFLGVVASCVLELMMLLRVRCALLVACCLSLLFVIC